jgi:hypothetical protein
MAPLTWCNYYARNRDDEGAIQVLFDRKWVFLANKTASHLESPELLSQTVGGHMFGSMMLVPGPQGQMQMLHHGFTCDTEDMGFQLVFAQGNLSDCCYFKVVPQDKVTDPIKVTEGRRTTTTNCPTLESMLTATTKEEFKNLPAQGNGILRQKPNHMMIHPEAFLMMDGKSTFQSVDLAMTILGLIRIDPDEDDEDMIEEKESAAIGAESVLAFLWASEKAALTPVLLSDVNENPYLNQTIRSIKEKLGGGGSPVNESRSDDGDEREARADAWAISSQSIVQELNRMHESRESARDLKEASQSLLKALGPDQKGLFTTLCTTDALIVPAMTPFMSSVTMTKTPQKAVSLLRAATRGWEGTFSDGCCHRLLANGFLSVEANPANPGGFTVFMFHPKTVDMGAKAFDSTTATLREYFGMDVDEATVEYYAKQGFFHATNQNDLRVQLQTALDMLELLTCKNSIASRGLHYILDPKRWRRFSTILHGRFLSDKSFGTKFLYSIDRALQVFFDRLSRVEDSDDDLADIVNLLTSKAKSLMTTVEYGETLAIELPAHLAQNPKTAATASSPKKTKTSTTATATTRPAKRATAATGFHHPSEDHTNKQTHPAWMVTQGVDYLDLFKDRAPGAKNWPKILDERLPKRNGKTRAAPLCVRFQMMGKCIHGCSLAHVHAKQMTQGEFGQTDRIIKEALAAAATTTP